MGLAGTTRSPAGLVTSARLVQSQRSRQAACFVQSSLCSRTAALVQVSTITHNDGTQARRRTVPQLSAVWTLARGAWRALRARLSDAGGLPVALESVGPQRANLLQ